MQYIVITGNPCDGFFFYGPFDTAEQANDWADREQHGMDWWVGPLATPEVVDAIMTEAIPNACYAESPELNHAETGGIYRRICQKPDAHEGQHDWEQ